MATVDENRAQWEGYDWQAGQGGDEWSQAWGGAASQWYASLLPRVAGLLPARRIVEIAPGYGRWTQFLLASCDDLIGVDLAAVCVEACRTRFAGRPGASFVQNDGATLPMVGSESVDLVFSFDSLVHVDWAPIESYLTEIERVLRPGGKAFLHHSNLAEILAEGVEPEQAHWRSREVSAVRVGDAAESVGLSVVVQETVNWGGPWAIDAFSLLVKGGTSARPRGPIHRNLEFMGEAALASKRAALWPVAPPAPEPAGGTVGRSPGWFARWFG